MALGRNVVPFSATPLRSVCLRYRTPAPIRAWTDTGAWKMNIAESNILIILYINFGLFFDFFIMPSSTLKNEIINLLTL